MTMGWIQNMRGSILLVWHGNCPGNCQPQTKVKDIFFDVLLLNLKSNNTNGKATSTFRNNILELLKGPLICYKVSKIKGRRTLFGMTTQQYVSNSSSTNAGKLRKNIPEPEQATQVVSSDNTVERNAHSDSYSTEELKSMLKLIQSKRKQYSYVIKQNIAEKIVATVMKHRTNPHAPILDIQEGPGLVSKEFLKQGVSKVVALGMNNGYSHLLSTLQHDVGRDKFCFFNWQMVNLFLKLHSSPQNEGFQTFQKMESDVADALVQSSFAQTEVPYSLISLGGKYDNNYFIFYVIRNLPNEDPILSHGRVEFFFLAHPKFIYKLNYIASLKKTDAGVYSALRDKTPSTHFNYIHALLYLLYNIKVLDQFDTDDLYPALKSIKATHNKNIDPSKRLLIRMQLKENIDSILPLHHHMPFTSFLCQILKKKSVRTIPSMEMLIPGCGLRMLVEGFTMMDIINVSNPEEFLKLYKMMIDWPEYKSSPLHSHLLLKMTGSAEDHYISDGDLH